MLRLFVRTTILLGIFLGQSSIVSAVDQVAISDAGSDDDPLREWRDDLANVNGVMPPWPITRFRRETPDSCGQVPLVAGASVAGASFPYQTEFAAIYDTLSYRCLEGFDMEGQSEIKCLPTLLWSEPPKCISNGVNPPDSMAWPEWLPSAGGNVVGKDVTESPYAYATYSSNGLPVTARPFIVRVNINIHDLHELFPTTTTAAPVTTAQATYEGNLSREACKS